MNNPSKTYWVLCSDGTIKRLKQKDISDFDARLFENTEAGLLKAKEARTRRGF